MVDSAGQEACTEAVVNIDHTDAAGAGIEHGQQGRQSAEGGLSALLSMLNSCASGVSVVNIDNGFGAGFLANRINHMEVRP